MTHALPQAAKPFVAFASQLRSHGFAVAPEQTTTFLTAIELLGPKSMGVIRQSAFASFAPPPERHQEFNALFDRFFLGQMMLPPAQQSPDDDEEDDLRVQEESDQGFEPLTADEINEVGQAATSLEALSARTLADLSIDDALRRFAREAPTRLPRRQGHRLQATRQGPRIDLRKSLREAVRTDGDVMQLPRLKRRLRQRPILLLIDVSGSMQAETDTSLLFAHSLAQAADRIEVFTLGTRLTRISQAVLRRNRAQALEHASALVSDWDGGTRLGDALQAFLAVPRFAGYARGALVLILSDGLERGDPTALRYAVWQLSQRAWWLSWLSPLALGPGYQPQTAALQAIAPYIDTFADASSLSSICAHVLDFNSGSTASFRNLGRSPHGT